MRSHVRWATMMAGAALLVAPVGVGRSAALAAPPAPQIVGVDAIVEVNPLGYAVSAVAIELSEKIHVRDADLDERAFAVTATLAGRTGARTVSDAYVSDSAERGDPERSG